MWERVKLGDIATFVNGYAFKPTDWSNEGLEIIRIQNLTKSSSEANYYKGNIPEKYKVIKGDILISWSATLGVYEWQGQDAWLNQHIFKVVFDKLKVNKSFFIHLIEYVLEDLKSQVHGATMKHITKGKFDNTLVPFPPLPIQERIAAILDKADELRRKDQELQDKYDELAQAIFIDMFGDPVRNEKGWEVKTLRQVTEHVGKINKQYNNETIKYYDISSVCRKKKETTHPISYNLASAPSRAQQIVKNRDILLSTVRPNLNTVAIINDYDENLIASTGFCVLRAGTLINNVFLFFCIQQSSFIGKLLSVARGANYPAVTNKDIMSIQLAVPPLHLQESFAKKIELINELKAKANTEKSEELFQSLLQRAFKGELISTTQLTE